MDTLFPERPVLVYPMLMPRKALTFLELLVVLSVMLVLFVLGLQAISSARVFANQMVGKKRISGLFFATEQFAATHNGKLPSSVHFREEPVSKVTVHQHLLWYLDGGRSYEEHLFDEKIIPRQFSFPAFLSPGDYSLNTHPGFNEKPGKLTSFPANAQVFGNRALYPKSFSDGTTNTLLFAERLSICGQNPFQTISNEIVISAGFQPILRRPTFADGGQLAGPSLNDIYPVTDSRQHVTRSSEASITFQSKPALTDCNPRVVQGLFGTLTCCMADGSVHSISPGISNTAFWCMMTMAGGEVFGD